MYKEFKKKLIAYIKAKRYLYNLFVRNELKEGFGKIEKHCMILSNCSIDRPENIYMDDYSRLNNLTNFISYKGKLVIKKYTAFGAGCTIVPGTHTPTVGIPQWLSYLHINDIDGTIVVNEDVWVGTSCILLSHCTIGRGAVIGAGSIVTKSVPPYSVVVGCPAKIIASRFSIEQIIEHEKILYPEEERMSEDELKELFSKNFQGMRSIGTSEISEEDRIRLEIEKKKVGIIDYSK
jgi:acetyltransferase-like isoleucine patch superfamily enzyme